MQNQWHRQTDRDAKPENSTDQAFKLFEDVAERRGINYHGDIVRANLADSVASGRTPQQAVDGLLAKAARFHRR